MDEINYVESGEQLAAPYQWYSIYVGEHAQTHKPKGFSDEVPGYMPWAHTNVFTLAGTEYELIDGNGAGMTNMMNVPDVAGVPINGHCDAAVTKLGVRRPLGVKSDLFMTVDMKKPDTVTDSSSFSQIMAYHIAADVSSSHHVLSLLTDLDKNWWLVWFTRAAYPSDTIQYDLHINRYNGPTAIAVIQGFLGYSAERARRAEVGEDPDHQDVLGLLPEQLRGITKLGGYMNAAAEPRKRARLDDSDSISAISAGSDIANEEDLVEDEAELEQLRKQKMLLGYLRHSNALYEWRQMENRNLDALTA